MWLLPELFPSLLLLPVAVVVILDSLVRTFCRNMDIYARVNIKTVDIVSTPTARFDEPQDIQKFLRNTAQHILVACLRRAQHNYFFKALHPREQIGQLERRWAEVFLLAAAHWPVDISCIIARFLRMSSPVSCIY